MSHTRWTATSRVVLTLFALVATQRAVVGQPPSDTPAEKPHAPRWEFLSADGKIRPVVPVGKSVTLATEYGTLKIPLTDLKRIEFGFRLTEAKRKEIEGLIVDLNGSSGRTRESAKQALIGCGLSAYPSVCRAIRTAPVEALPHLTAVKDRLISLVGEGDEPRDQDVVLTADGSRFVGSLSPATIEVKLNGEAILLGWPDGRVLAFGGLEQEEKVEVVELGPNGVHGLMTTHFGKVVGVKVTGTTAGSVWGSNPYTTDSTLDAAAVHAGVVREGETAVIKLRVKADAGGYTGSTRNGVTTSNWGPYQGCFELIVKKQRGN